MIRNLVTGFQTQNGGKVDHIGVLVVAVTFVVAIVCCKERSVFQGSYLGRYGVTFTRHSFK